jgi:hypothetical protein
MDESYPSNQLSQLTQDDVTQRNLEESPITQNEQQLDPRELKPPSVIANNIRVAVRVRPLLKSEHKKGERMTKMHVDPSNGQISMLQVEQTPRKGQA